MVDFATELEKVMHSRNFFIKGKINYTLSNKFQRFYNARKRGGKDLFVKVHDYDRGASFGDWHYPEDWYTHWNSVYGRPNIIELLARKKEQEERQIQQKYERVKAEWRAKEFFHKFYCSQYTDEHSYVLRKRIRAYYSRQVRSWLIIPIRDIEYNLKTIQIIKPDGFKRLWKGTSQKGNMIWLSEPLPQDYKGMIRICEGYATGCSIYEVIGTPVICAINAQNIILVCQLLKKQFPLATLIICADNDAWSHDNPGIKYAVEAMKLTGAMMRRPSFIGYDVSTKPTDFNDLLCLGGIEIVENQLLKQYK